MKEGASHNSRKWGLISLLTLAGWAMAGQSSGPAGANPFNTPEGASQGRALFQIHCSYCHGANGEGGRGADLTSGQYRRGGSDAELYATVRNGIGSEMPAVRASDDEVWKMVAFVKIIGSSGLAEKATGDPSAGKRVYAGKGGCAACHSIAREGGTLGPDLDGVGRRRSLNYLRESLVDPDADVALSYRAIQVVMKSGHTIAGIRLNEDDISIQLRDLEDRLRSFLKDEIQEIRRNRPSLMPSYTTVLSEKELEDVVAYLSSLRGTE
jgi:putative heme-binding domain-containing protein